MHTNTFDSIYRTIKAINDYEGKKYRENRTTKYSRLTIRLYFELIVLPFCIAVLLGLSKKFLGAPDWFAAPGLAALLLSYIGIVLHPIISTIINRRKIIKYIRNPFALILNNAKISTTADQKFFKYLYNKEIHDLKLIRKNLLCERDGFLKRVSLLVGAIEKIGIVPGVFALYVSFAKLSNPMPDWISMVAYATPILNVLGATAHFYILKLEKMAFLLELVIEEKGTQP